MSGRELSDAEINELWQAWTPREVAQRMSKVTAPWYVAAGSVLELFTDTAAHGLKGEQSAGTDYCSPVDLPFSN
jgi:hypothetical protein